MDQNGDQCGSNSDQYQTSPDSFSRSINPQSIQPGQGIHQVTNVPAFNQTPYIPHPQIPHHSTVQQPDEEVTSQHLSIPSTPQSHPSDLVYSHNKYSPNPTQPNPIGYAPYQPNCGWHSSYQGLLHQRGIIPSFQGALPILHSYEQGTSFLVSNESQLRVPNQQMSPQRAPTQPMHQRKTQQPCLENVGVDPREITLLSNNPQTLNNQTQNLQSLNLNVSAPSATIENSIVGAGSVTQIHGGLYQYFENVNSSSHLSGDERCGIEGLLLEATQEQCKSKGFQVLTQQQIEICKLEITDKPSKKVYPAGQKPAKNLAPFLQYSDEDGHYNRSQDYETIDLKQDSKISVEELFARAEKAAYDRGMPRYANIVALIGQPGIGKTTLSKVITEKAICGEMDKVDEIQFCFYISVKKIDFDTPTTFVKFLLKNALPTDSYAESPIEERTEKSFFLLLAKSKKVLITVDGLDEAATEWKLKYKNVDPYDKHHSLHYVYGLMKGDLLKNAKKIFTSRQNHFFSIEAEYRPLFVAEVMGLNEKSQEKLCNQICIDNGADVWNVIKGNPNFFYSCYVPAKCIFISFVIWKSLKEDNKGRFHSLTHVFANGFLYYFKQDFVRGEKSEMESYQKEALRKNYLSKICELAWNGFNDKKFVFRTVDFEAVGIEQNTLTGLLVSFVTKDNWNIKIMSSEVVSNFAHLIWLEYFAACNLVFFSSVEEFTKLLPEFKTNRWEVVTKFVFGLCNDKVSEVAKDCFSNTKNEAIASKKSLLKKFCLKQLQTSEFKQKELLQICSWLHEVDDETFYEDSFHLLPETLTLTGNILPTDAYSIGCVFTKSKRLFNIEIAEGCKFFYGSFEILLDLMRNHIQDFSVCEKVTIQEIKALARNCPAIKGELIIGGSSFSSNNFFKTFVKNIQPASKVKILNLSKASVSRSVLPSLLDECFLDNVDKLFVSKFKISEIGIKNVGKIDLLFCISEKQTKLMKMEKNCIDFVFENLVNLDSLLQFRLIHTLLEIDSIPHKLILNGDEEAFALSCVLHLFPPTLELTLRNVSSFALQEVARSIKQKMTSLKLIDITVDNGSASAITSCIPWLENLSLEGCKTTTVGISRIANSISKLQKPMTSLNLDRNCIHDKVAPAIASCIEWIKDLSMRDCKMTSNCICEMLDSISQNQKPMTSLKLDKNKIDDKCASAIASSIQWIDNLSLGGCGMTSDGICKIANSISQLQKKMTLVNLDGNTIDDESASAIASCIEWIENLSLQYCRLSSAVFCIHTGISRIATSISQLNKPMESLYISISLVSKPMLPLIMDKAVLTNLKKMYMSKIKISKEGIKNIGVCDLIPCISKCSAQEEDITTKFIDSLFEVKSIPQDLTVIDDEEAWAFSYVTHLFPPTLELTLRHISNPALQEVARAITQKITSVILIKSPVNDKSASAIGQCIQWIENLSLRYCYASSAGICNIANSISKLRKPMTSLKLYKDMIDIKSASAVASCIQWIENLSITYCEMTSACICKVANSTSKLSKPMTSLTLDENSVDDESACAIASCIEWVNNLSLVDSRMTSVGICKIANSVSQLEKLMNSLNLDKNKVDDESASAIASCIQWINNLSLGGCEMTSGGICMISNSISQLQKPMSKLDFRGNDIHGDTAKALLKCVHNIQDELDVSRPRIVNDFEEEFSNLPDPKPKLTVWG